MLSNIFVFIILAMTPDGRLHKEFAGEFTSEAGCKAKWEEFQVAATEAGLPLANFRGACIKTPFQVKTGEVPT